MECKFEGEHCFDCCSGERRGGRCEGEEAIKEREAKKDTLKKMEGIFLSL